MNRSGLLKNAKNVVVCQPSNHIFVECQGQKQLAESDPITKIR